MIVDPAGTAPRCRLAALAGRYGAAEFSARDAAASIPGALREAVGVPRPDAGSCGRWLRFRKGAVAGFVPGNRPDRDGIALWRLRGTAGDAPAGRAGSGEERREALSPKAGVGKPGKPGMTGGVPHPPPPPPPDGVPPEPVQVPPPPPPRAWWSMPPGPSPHVGGAAPPRGEAWWMLGPAPGEEPAP